MKKLRFTLLLCVLLFSFLGNAQNRPFPQQKDWDDCIKPSNRTQAQLDTDVVGVYTYWRDTYLKPATTGGYYVSGEATGGNGKGTSEGHGYGMLITALMAGQDANAKTYFDGLFQFFDSHRSSINNELMGWLVDATEATGYSSASDGDMDVAYALLLAHYQWGSTGSINYLQEAKDMISAGVKVDDMHATSKRVMLGDWDNNQYTTRPSDWMTSHMRAYKEVTNDVFWDETANKVYELTNSIQTNYSSTTGLLPDFVVGATPEPSAPNFLEAATDDDFSWNACRFPWRITMDYGHYGTTDAKTAVNKFMNWAKTVTSNDPSAFKAGYTLAGSSLVNYTDLAFTAPLVTAATVDVSHQAYLNSGWAILRNGKNSYFGTSINLLCMLYISGNWWVPAPDVIVGNDVPVVSILSPVSNSMLQANTNTTVSVSATDPDGTVTAVSFLVDGVVVETKTIAPYDFVLNFSENEIGTYTVTAKAVDNQGASTISDDLVLHVFVPQGPFQGTVAAIPGVIEAENYDVGGEGVAFHETSSTNQGGASYRSDVVDIETLTTGYGIGYITGGEWLEYSVDVAASADYSIDFLVAAEGAGGSFKLLIDDQEVLGATNSGSTTGWSIWDVVSVAGVDLTVGEHVLKFEVITGDFNLDKMTFTKETPVVLEAPTVSISSPTSGSSFETDENITVTVDAADSDGTVSSVDLYIDGVLHQTKTNTPYTFTLNFPKDEWGLHELTAKATDNDNLSTTSSVVNALVVVPQPVVTITSPKTGSVFKVNENIFVDLTMTGNASSVTLLIDGVEVESLTTAPYEFTTSFGVADLGKHTISVKVIDANNVAEETISTPVEVTITEETVQGVFGQGLFNSLKIYPNPSNDIVNVDLLDSFSEGTVKIIDHTGKVMFSEELTDGQIKSIDISQLEEGTYVLIVQSVNQTSQNKLIKL